MLRITAYRNYGQLQEASREWRSWHRKGNILKAVLLHPMSSSPSQPPAGFRQVELPLYCISHSAPLSQASEQLPDTILSAQKHCVGDEAGKGSSDYLECHNVWILFCPSTNQPVVCSFLASACSSGGGLVLLTGPDTGSCRWRLLRARF